MKKALSFVLCMVLALGLLAGCGNGSGSVGSQASGGEAPAGTAEGNNEVDFSQHEEFTIWLFSTPNDYYAVYSDNPVVKYLNEKFNVTLTFEQPVTGTEADSLSLMFGTGEYTDMINMSQYTGSINQLYEDGVIVDLAQYLEYMPNLQRLMDADEGLRQHTIDDNGRMLELPATSDEPETIWGGLLYRYDILETMTGGNVQFPSGNEIPTTVEDWDYMLPLFKAYFEAAGMSDYAALILPYNGYFPYGELGTGFGYQSGGYYVDGGEVKHSFMDEGLYDYLEKMNEWYEAGYIYQDFASRINDIFFLPNTNLTYGGAAGIWYGLDGQLGDTMSMPEYGLEMDVRPLPSPLADGVAPEQLMPRAQAAYEAGGRGSVITSACGNIPKLLTILDYMYSEEGGMLRKYGLTAEQIPESDSIHAQYGLEDGAYWFEGDTLVVNPLLDLAGQGGELAQGDITGMRLPGYYINSYSRQVFGEAQLEGDRVWTLYDDVAKLERLPTALTFSNEDDKFMADAMVSINDYVSTMIPNFIMGTEALNEESFAAFQQQLVAYGINECIDINQAAYELYLKR